MLQQILFNMADPTRLRRGTVARAILGNVFRALLEPRFAFGTRLIVKLHEIPTIWDCTIFEADQKTNHVCNLPTVATDLDRFN